MKITDNIVHFMCRVYRMKLTTSTGGNISIKDSEGNIWITPASLDKSDLSPEDIVCIKKDGVVVGKHQPSSELMFHQSIYNSRPDISTILHAHPDPLVTFSAIQRMPDISLYYGLEYYLGSVGHVEYALTGSSLLATKIAEKFSEGHNIVLLENHGVVSVGRDLLDAYAGFDALIHLARIEINSASLGKLHSPTHQLPPYRSVPRQESWSFFLNDKLDYVEHRKDICNFASRAYSQELFTATSGSICIRVDSDYLVTPFSVDRAEMSETDIVLVRGQHCEEGKAPSDFTSIFISIINGNNNFSCVFFAQPAHLMAFNLTGIEFSSRIIPEAYIFLRDVKVLPQDELLSVSDYMNDSCPVVMVKNVGVFVAGDSMFRAFDRLELLEFTAKSLIGAYQLGGIRTISDERISELVKALKLPE